MSAIYSEEAEQDLEDIWLYVGGITGPTNSHLMVIQLSSWSEALSRLVATYNIIRTK